MVYDDVDPIHLGLGQCVRACRIVILLLWRSMKAMDAMDAINPEIQTTAASSPTRTSVSSVLVVSRPETSIFLMILAGLPATQ